MKIRYLIIPLFLSVYLTNANAQTDTKTNAAVIKKTKITNQSKPSKAQLDSLAKKLIQPIKAIKDPAIKPIEFSNTIKPSVDFYDYINQK